MLQAKVRALFSFRSSQKSGRLRHQVLGLSVGLPVEPVDDGNSEQSRVVSVPPANSVPKSGTAGQRLASKAYGAPELSGPAGSTDESQTQQEGAKAGNARLFRLGDGGAGVVPKSGDCNVEHPRLASPGEDPPQAASGGDSLQPADSGPSVSDRLRTLEADVAALRQASLFSETDDLQSGFTWFDLDAQQSASEGDLEKERLRNELRQLCRSMREVRERVLAQGAILWALEQALRDHVSKIETQVSALAKRLQALPDRLPFGDPPHPAGEQSNSPPMPSMETPALVGLLKCHTDAILAICDVVLGGTEAWAQAAAVARRHVDLALPKDGGEHLPPAQ
jgi:hypothetical protein